MQDMPRLYLDREDILPEQGGAIALEAGQVRYLATVLRLEPGDTICVFNETLGEWEARLTLLRKDRGTAELSLQRRAPAPALGPVLFFAPLKRDATDLVIRMGTELGVVRFCPVVTERTNTHRINAERFRAIAIEAAEQCERLDIPVIDPLVPLFQALEGRDTRRPLFAALERSEPDEVRAVSAEYALLIGPEGGFSDNERRYLLGHEEIGTISLGKLVLRADTAVATGLAQLAFRAGQSI